MLTRTWIPILGLLLLSLTVIPFVVFDSNNVQKPQKGSIHKRSVSSSQKSNHVKSDTKPANHHKKLKQHKKSNTEELQKVQKVQKSTITKKAHVAVVGNENYVDGGLVMGSSLLPYKTSEVELVCMVTRGKISEMSIQRLIHSGWDRVIEVDSPAWRVPTSMWKESFVKLHVFNLTEYEMVAYWDADMLVIADPTSIFNIPVPTDWVAAIGSKPTKEKTYFQTGMMVFHPSENLRSSIWSHFVSHPSRYDSHNSRDGMLLRNYFGVNYTTIPNKFSRNLDPRKKAQDLIGIHYRGGWKPWFDRRKPMQKKTEDTRKDFGYAYQLWWNEFEKMHIRTSISESEIVLKGGETYNPKRHVWLLRNTANEYVQLLSSVEKAERNISYPGVSFLISNEDESCTSCCSRTKLVCHAPSLSTTSLNSCEFTSSVLAKYDEPPCGPCEPAIYTKQRNGSSFPGIAPSKKKRELTCYYNMLLDERGIPLCDASGDEIRRICPCAESTS